MSASSQGVDERKSNGNGVLGGADLTRVLSTLASLAEAHANNTSDILVRASQCQEKDIIYIYLYIFGDIYNIEKNIPSRRDIKRFAIRVLYLFRNIHHAAEPLAYPPEALVGPETYDSSEKVGVARVRRHVRMVVAVAALL